MSENPYLAPSSSPLSPPPLPPQIDQSPWNAWWTLLWAFGLILGWQIIMAIGIGVAAALSKIPLKSLIMDGDAVGLITFTALFIICPACWLMGQLRPGWAGWDYLGNRKTKWWHWPASGAAVIACSFIFGLIGPHLGIDGPDDSMVVMGQSTDYPILLFLGVAIGAPLIEEFMFRGALWRGWRASRLRLLGTLFLTSLIWAILHVQYPGIIIAYIFCLGLLLGGAREITGNLWVPVWMHALNNALATLSMLSL